MAGTFGAGTWLVDLCDQQETVRKEFFYHMPG